MAGELTSRSWRRRLGARAAGSFDWEGRHSGWLGRKKLNREMTRMDAKFKGRGGFRSNRIRVFGVLVRFAEATQPASGQATTEGTEKQPEATEENPRGFIHDSAACLSL
jgi:hypothetical protein